MGVSCLGTIRAKLANFGRFGFSKDEILWLFGRSPFLMTLSIEKVQRNMTFILGTMKLEAKIILTYPFLLYVNLDTLLKPRVFLVRKIHDMGLILQITGPTLLRALKMTERRFLKDFVDCHQKDVADELMEFYIRTKEVKRLAESSKKCILRGFSF
ncbi:hypothetical protein L6164_018129 [Bauhinia variegata]|uniref:Uncharacterized protein n=1 Tax=Bauhinia variegata TaxID=167791 RepID=A0ACB9NA90_BAUVA|nr:hypothetical protein L6164_018129 [Bauhinia variegata]